MLKGEKEGRENCKKKFTEKKSQHTSWMKASKGHIKNVIGVIGKSSLN